MAEYRQATQPQPEDFEKWLRMATDNKINSQNSWNLSLIDYFHDMELLKDGDDINFQKASATLDGCVKIYSSRVDSAVTETGKLINGLSNSKLNSTKINEGEEEEQDQAEDGDDLDRQTIRRQTNRNINKNTLVKFDAIKAKKGDLEMYVDPLLKKTIAEFDEGGSKSLLLNMLNINDLMKIALDTTETAESLDLGGDEDKQPEEKYDDILTELNDEVPSKDTQPTTAENELEEDESNENRMEVDEEPHTPNHENRDDFQLAQAPFDQTMTEEQLMQFVNQNINALSDKLTLVYKQPEIDLCESMKSVKAVLNNEISPTDLLRHLENMVMYDSPPTPTNFEVYEDNGYDFSIGGYEQDEDRVPLDNDDGNDPNASRIAATLNSIFFDEDEEDEIDNFGISMRMLFNEEKSFIDEREITMLGEKENDHLIGSVTNMPNENLLAYFDRNQRKNWAGPEHWKIQKMKRSFNFREMNKQPNADNNEEDEEFDEYGELNQKGKKIHLNINFMDDLDSPDPDEIFTVSDRPQLLRVADQTSKTHNLLPDDKNFTTRVFIRLFSKDQVIHSRFNKSSKSDDLIDASVFAEEAQIEDDENSALNNADFFNDDDNRYDDYDDGGFDDYDEAHDGGRLLPPPPITSSQRFQGITYSKVSKKVDVKLLKDRLWDTLAEEVAIRLLQTSQRQNQSTPDTSQSSLSTVLTSQDEMKSPPRKRQALLPEFQDDKPLKFSQVVHDLGGKYDPKTRRDLSTSFCFISLLHLANEKGFSIEAIGNNKDLVIKDLPEVEIRHGGEEEEG